MSGLSDGKFLESLLDPGAAGALVLKQNPRRSVYQLDAQPGPLIVKHYRCLGGLDRVKSRLGRGRAAREWGIARSLRQAGLPAPEPLVLGVRRVSGKPEFSLLVSRLVPDAEPLGGFLERQFRPGDGREEAKSVWLDRAVRLLVRLHRAGFDHRDYHGGNVLVSGAVEPEQSLTVIDLHRVTRTSRLSTKRRLLALTDLLHTLRFSLDPGLTRVAVVAYLEADGRPKRLASSWELRVQAALLVRERRRVRSRTRRCVKVSSEFEPVRAGGVRGFKRRNVTQDDLFRAVESARSAIREGGAAVRSLARRSSVALAECGDLQVAVKTYEQDGARRSIRGRLSSGRAHRAYVAAHGLHVRGVPVPPVLAWLRTPDRAFLVTRAVAGAVPLSVHSFGLAAGCEFEADARPLGTAVARLLIALFRSGVRVNDLSPKNILIGADRSTVTLCDFDGVSLNRRSSRERMLRGLAQINDLAPGVPVRFRVRVFGEVAAAVPEVAGREQLRNVCRQTQARAARSLGRPAAEAVSVGALAP